MREDGLFSVKVLRLHDLSMLEMRMLIIMDSGKEKSGQ